MSAAELALNRICLPSRKSKMIQRMAKNVHWLDSASSILSLSGAYSINHYGPVNYSQILTVNLQINCEHSISYGRLAVIMKIKSFMEWASGCVNPCIF